MLLQQFFCTITCNIRNTGYTNDLINNHLCATLFYIQNLLISTVNLMFVLKEEVVVFTNKAKNEQNIHKLKLRYN